MGLPIVVLGEALMDCIAQPDGRLLPLQGGSPYNMARAAALRGAQVAYLNPLSTDLFGQGLGQRLRQDGVALSLPPSRRPTSLAVVQLTDGQPSYGFYREGIADRDYTPEQVRSTLAEIGGTVVETPAGFSVTPPSWRPDLTDKWTLAEEVARIFGYDVIPASLPVAPPGRGYTVAQVVRRRVSDALAAAGKHDFRVAPLQHAERIADRAEAAVEQFGGAAGLPAERKQALVKAVTQPLA